MESEHLLEGVNAKNMQAWEELYAAYYASLCSYVNSLIQERDSAQDIVQEVLVTIWRSRLVFGHIRELTAYLYRACYNNALIFGRNRQLRRGIEARLEFETLDDPDAMFAVTLREEMIRRLYIHIDELPDGSRKILELTVRGLSGPQIAKKLGVSINTVKTQKSRGFRFLRERMKDPLLLLFL